MDSTVPSGKEKRKSENQLTKDDPEVEEEGATEGVFQKANEDVLKTRKICKVKRTAPSVDGAKTKNPFASVSLQKEETGATETKALGGFGGLAATGNGFGGLASSKPSGLAFGKAPAADENPTNKAVAVFGSPENASSSQEKKNKELESTTNQESLKTGEEGEDTLYQCSASLYEFHNSQWKEKGKGVIKVNKDKEKKASRLIMRQQGNLKLLLNANLWSGMKMTKMDESKGLSFTCINHVSHDASEGTSLKMFAIRGREASSINELYSTIQGALAEM